MRKVIILVSFLILSISYGKNPKIINLGKLNGWGYLYHQNTKYHNGFDDKDIILKDNAYSPDHNVDLLIHFDGKTNKPWTKDKSNITRNYSVRKKRFLFDSKNKVYGESAAKFIHNNSTINLRPKAGSWFNRTSHAGSFTIEFWLNPSTLSDEQVILKKYGPIIANGLVDKYSGIICKIKNRRLNWEFHNMFHLANYSYDKKDQLVKELVKITSYSRLRQYKWMHHAVTFDALSGKMIYYVNGKAQKTIFITASGQPYDTILTPKFHSEEKSLFIIGERFYGFMDELMIYTDYKVPHPLIIRYSGKYKEKQYFKTKKYSSLEGLVTSGIFDHKFTGSYLKRVKVNASELGGSQIDILYRMSDKYFSPSDNLLKWHELKQNDISFRINKSPMGRFFQWKAILKSSYDGKHSPILKDISFHFVIDNNPSSPKGLTAYSSRGKVFLKWKGNLERDIKEYRIYYGIHKGTYLGEDNNINTKPITIAINQLSNRVEPYYAVPGLSMNRVYFFVITAVDKHNHESIPSDEVSIKVR